MPTEGSILKYFTSTGAFGYATDNDSNPWLGVPGGVAYNGITVTNNEIALASTSAGSLVGTTSSLRFAWNNTPRLGYFNSSSEFGPNANNTVQLGSSFFRWSEIWSANGINQTSDRRLKKEITPLSYGLSAVMNMAPVSYKWKEGSTDTQLGFIAQDMETVVPEVVSHTQATTQERQSAEADGRVPSEDMYAMNYSKLIPVLVKAIQEQQEQIELLKAEISKLQN